MTGYTVHTGSSEKFSQGWDQIFKSRAAGKSSSGKKSTPKKSAPKKSVSKKSAPKKSTGKKKSK